MSLCVCVFSWNVSSSHLLNFPPAAPQSAAQYTNTHTHSLSHTHTVCVCLLVYVCMYVCMYMYVYAVCVSVCVCVCVLYKCTPIFSPMHRNLHARTHAHTHTHAHAHHTMCSNRLAFGFSLHESFECVEGMEPEISGKVSAPLYLPNKGKNGVLLRTLAETTLTSPRAPQQIQRAHREGARESRAHAAKLSRLRLSRQRQSPRRPRMPPPAAVPPAPSLLLQSPRRPRTPSPGGVSPAPAGRGPEGRCGAEWAGPGGRAACACWHECRPRTLSTEPRPVSRPEPRAPTTGACARVGLDPVADRIHAALSAAAAAPRPPSCCSPAFWRGELR